MNRFFCILILFAALTTAAHGATTRITSEKGEKWWGLHEQPGQPFSAGFTARVEGDWMLLSSLGRYAWSAEAASVRFDGETFEIETAGTVETEKAGRNLREAYLVCCHKHCPPDPAVTPDPAQFSAPYYETALEFGNEHTPAGLVAYAERLVKEGYPAGVLVIAPGWSRGDGLYDFDPEYYPDPKAFIDRLHALGFRVMLTVTPFVNAAGRGFLAAIREGMLLANPDGSISVHSGEDGYRACLDLSKDAALERTRERLTALLDRYGVDGLRLECAAVEAFLPEGQSAEFLARWTSLGTVTPLAQWAGGSDTHAGRVTCLEASLFEGWKSLQQVPDRVLAAGLAGAPLALPCWNALAGSVTDPKLVARTLQLCASLPVCTVPFAPWRAGDQAAGVKTALKRRMEMNPHIAELVTECVRTAEPPVRSLEYVFPRSGFSDCTDQFMIGNRYLVAPALTETGALVRLPRGMWVDAAGKRHRGPLVIPADNGPQVYELVK